MLRRIGICVALGGSLLGCGVQSSPDRQFSPPSSPDETSLVAFEGEEPSLEPVPEMDSEGKIDSTPNGAEATSLPQATRSPFIAQPYSEWGLQETVVDSLARIGAPAVPALERMLRHPEAERRIQAANILARIGPQAEDAVSGLVDALADQDQRVRKAAARALGQIGPGAADAVGPLLRALEETSDTAPPEDATLP